MPAVLAHRLARLDDLDALRRLMDAAIAELQRPFLDERQIASSRTLMGLDTQLIADGTYFVVEADGCLAGCGGWSRRATLYGGDQSPGRSAALLDPARDPARVRAMYTHPQHVRKGVGRLILGLCEEAARREGFARVELMATLAGEPLYRACGYEAVERLEDARGGAAVPLVRMRKHLPPTSSRSAGGPTMDATPEVSTATLQAFADAWNRHDVEALMSFMTADCVFESSAGPDVCGTRYAGRDAVRAGFADVWAVFPDAHWGDARHFVDGDRGVSEWTFTGTRADGSRVEVHGCDLFTFRDGKIALKNSYRKNRLR